MMATLDQEQSKNIQEEDCNLLDQIKRCREPRGKEFLKSLLAGLANFYDNACQGHHQNSDMEAVVVTPKVFFLFLRRAFQSAVNEGTMAPEEEWFYSQLLDSEPFFFRFSETMAQTFPFSKVVIPFSFSEDYLLAQQRLNFVSARPQDSEEFQEAAREFIQVQSRLARAFFKGTEFETFFSF